MKTMQDEIKDDARILIVDDNPKNLQVLGRVLQANKYEVEFSTSGNGAIQWLEKDKFDLLLLDVMMPEMDGFEVCRKIRSQKSNDELPIIFLTAKTDKTSIVSGFKQGAQDYITKPFDAEELLARVDTQLELKYSRQKLKRVNKWLEQQVAERTKELAGANKKLQEFDEVKNQFLNMISHEIRTPLNGILGPLQLLKIRSENKELIDLIHILDVIGQPPRAIFVFSAANNQVEGQKV